MAGDGGTTAIDPGKSVLVPDAGPHQPRPPKVVKAGAPKNSIQPAQRERFGLAGIGSGRGAGKRPSARLKKSAA